MYISLCSFCCSLNLDLCNTAGETALWLALQKLPPGYVTTDDPSEFDDTFAARLIKRGASTDSTDRLTKNTILHRAALESKEGAAVFLVHHGALTNPTNTQGEAPIHIAARNGLSRLVRVLLQYSADPNLQTALKPKQAKRLSPLVTSPVADEFPPSVLSPTTLGALSALTMTSQAVVGGVAGYSIGSGSSVQSSVGGASDHGIMGERKWVWL